MSQNSTSSWVANNSLPSAFIGQPPNTQRDWYIVRGLLRLVGMPEIDPAEGYVLAATDTGDTETKRPAVMAGLITCLVAISGVTLSRLALRASMTSMRVGNDDWATIAAAAMGLTYTGCQLMMAIKGGGDHIWEHSYEDYNTFNYFGVLDKLFFYLTVAFVKLSLALFIRRLADRVSKMWRWFCDAFIVTLILYILTATIWFLITCDPMIAQWSLLYRGQMDELPYCLDTTLWGQIFNIAHVLQGTLLLVSPVVILWKVTMEIKKKCRLFFIWGCGLVVVLFGLMRLLRSNFTADIFWSYTELLVWTSLDVTVGCVVISLPVLDAWLAAGARKALTKMGRTNGGGMNNSGYGNLDKSNSGFGTSRTMKSTRSSRTGASKSVGHDTPADIGDVEEGFAHAYARVHGNTSPVELTIMRTDEYAVRFSTVEEEEAGMYGAKACVTPGVEKFHGIAK